jgi:RNA polymerase sigma-70 factor (ECF subfamily)
MRSLIKQLKSDQALIRDYQRGDPKAFDVLYMRHKDKLFNFLYRSCQDRHAVEDIAHDTWVAVIRSIARFRPDSRFTTWLYTIARNKLVDHWRKQSSIPFHSDGLEYVATDDAIHRNMHHDLEQLQLVNEVMHALRDLPVEQREAFLLREEGFSQKEIADITGARPETVKSRVRYAREHLRVQMGATT